MRKITFLELAKRYQVSLPVAALFPVLIGWSCEEVPWIGRDEVYSAMDKNGTKQVVNVVSPGML